jgi:hypothetical protein
MGTCTKIGAKKFRQVDEDMHWDLRALSKPTATQNIKRGNKNRSKVLY